MSLDMLKLAPGVKVGKDKDTLGGNGPQATDIYAATCEHLYIDQTDSGAVMVYGSFKLNDGPSVRFSECIMSKKSGTLKPTYTDKRSGKEEPLPGYSKVLHLAHAIGLKVADLSELVAEKKILKLYDFDAGKELPQEKNVLTAFKDKALQIALYNQVETKMAKDAEGKYTVPTSEERTLNTFEKWFTAEGLTIEEAAEGEEATFRDIWLEAHKGKVRDKRKKDAPKAGAAPAASTAKTLKFD